MMALHIPEENRSEPSVVNLRSKCSGQRSSLLCRVSLQVYRHPGALRAYGPADVPLPHSETLRLRVRSGQQPRGPRPL